MMDKLLEEMIDKGLASIENREILARIPVWFAALRKYEPHIFHLLKWVELNKN